jgi:preprotein translocase subunit SecB
MAEEIAKFRFMGHQIIKSLIEIKDASNIDKELEIEIQRSEGVNDEECQYKTDLEIRIKDSNSALNIEIFVIGYFEFNKDISEKEKDIFFNINAPAILFPYIRAFISTLTVLSGISPITLPTINLASRG